MGQFPLQRFDFRCGPAGVLIRDIRALLVKGENDLRDLPQTAQQAEAIKSRSVERAFRIGHGNTTAGALELKDIAAKVQPLFPGELCIFPREARIATADHEDGWSGADRRGCSKHFYTPFVCSRPERAASM